MRLNKYKLLALTSAIVMQMVAAPSFVNAADNADVTVDIETAAGITAVTQTDMDFGSWLIGVHTGATPQIIMAAGTGVLSTASLGGSQVINLTGATSGTRGTVLVTLPAGANGITLQMTRGTITQFTDTSLSLGTITYVNSDDGDESGTLASGSANAVPITVDVGATGATVGFGGTITASATPVGDAVVHTASFDVAFAY